MTDKRPKTRSECPPRQPNGRRYCPWIGCRHHLVVDVGQASSTCKEVPLKVPGIGVATDDQILAALDERTKHCSLDVADQGPHTLAEVGEALDLTRERVRQVEAGAFRRASLYAPYSCAQAVDIPLEMFRARQRYFRDRSKRR